jgi:hypothetical protein
MRGAEARLHVVTSARPSDIALSWTIHTCIQDPTWIHPPKPAGPARLKSPSEPKLEHEARDPGRNSILNQKRVDWERTDSERTESDRKYRLGEDRERSWRHTATT